MPDHDVVAPRVRRDFPLLCREKWRGELAVAAEAAGTRFRLACPAAGLPALCHWLASDIGCVFATLIVEERAADWLLTYVFHDASGGTWVHVEVQRELSQATLPSISHLVHAADWHEREAEDLFGLGFEGHPRLGEFVLHEDWPEGVNPMRRGFDARQRPARRERDPQWQPPTILEAPGAFAMPIGPVFSDTAEAAHFSLETVGEDVIRTIPRFFYKYRGVEKIAEGQTADRVVLLAERFSGSSAFAHGLAFCQAVEAIGEIEVPPRARALRTVFAELERLRHHAAAITAICNSTALAVGTSQAAILEEELLRLSGSIGGHRYLFGLVKPGGLTCDYVTDEDGRRLADTAGDLAVRLGTLQEMLKYTSSFLDRLEEVGVVATAAATAYGLVGPIARASGVARDLRQLFPYAMYGATTFTVPMEAEGDGYARLRILFREATQSAAIIRQITASLPSGPIEARPCALRAGVALAAVEAPLGAAFHWLRLGEDGIVARYRVTPPSFANWHGFHLAAENFAFQDFPIILATFGLSNAESDR